MRVFAPVKNVGFLKSYFAEKEPAARKIDESPQTTKSSIVIGERHSDVI